MKKVILLFLFATQGVFAAIPSDEAIKTCLSSGKASPKITFHPFATGEVLSEDDYKSGYSASFYIKTKLGDVGYAEGNKDFALILSGRIYSLRTAKSLSDKGIVPSPFNPNLADWGEVEESTGKYLCTSFNFDGLGRSGTFQNVRAGYLLEVHAPHELYFAVKDIRDK